MDKINIHRLEVFANHGVLEEEKALGQKFFVSAELALDLREAGTTDELSKTVNYALVCDGITAVMKGERFNLIERCAEKIAEYILQKYARVRSVAVTIEKPFAPIRQSAGLSVQVSRKWSRVFLGLGSNIGDKAAALNAAIENIRREGIRILKKSSYYNTKPVSPVPQDDFLNCVIETETILSPAELIERLLRIEGTMGRERVERWGPRTIDIDVLTYDNLVSDDERVILPHPLMHERLFVLAPFCELAPNFVHPLLHRRLIDIKAGLEQ